MILRFLAILSFAAALAVAGDKGMGLDPNGGTANYGPGSDPNGGIYAANIDKGMGLDPNG